MNNIIDKYSANELILLRYHLVAFGASKDFYGGTNEHIEISKKRTILLSVALITIMLLSYTGLAIAASSDIYPFSAGKVSQTAEIILWPWLTSEFVEGGDGNPYKQRSYALPKTGAGDNYGCCVVSMAIGNSILDKKSHGPREYLANGATDNNPLATNTGLGSKYSLSSSNKRNRLKEMYNAINKGKPVRFFIGIDSSNSGHFVLVNGYTDDAYYEFLDFSDFLCVDPVSGEEVNLTKAWGWNKSTLSYCSFRIFK